MKKQEITISYTVYASEKELKTEDLQLLQEARKVLAQSHSPYSKFRVGAAILLENGAIVAGANQENAAYPMCLCAERVALAAAVVQHPGVAVRKMAITVASPSGKVTVPAAPCGACRQVISETEDRQKGQAVEIILQGETGPVYHLPNGRSLLPFAFDGGFLD